MVRPLVRVSAVAALLLAATTAHGQVVGENVNMVSGTSWPGGDPFLQRQNEPSMAVSSVNPQHLLAAANDYRSVDVPNPNFGLKVNGDAWLGVFKSLDGGQTWKSVLLPGYPQDAGCTSPAPPAPAGHVHHHRCGHTEAPPTVGGQFALCGLPAAADPVVRAGTDGMFYVGGINFQRDKTRSRLFIARYVDANNKENGDATRATDPIRYVDTRVIAESAPNVFIDKPWFAVDVPRPGAATCTVPLTDDPNGPKRTFPGGTVYAAWAEFALPNEDASTLKFTWSKDCGRTWVAPIKVNTANGILNQGVTIAIEPVTGRVYLAWRRFGIPGKQTDAILVTRSEGRSKHFAAPRVISRAFTPFEQFMEDKTFRAEAFPSLAISTDGTKSWAHVAWSQRKPTGEGRIHLSTAQVHPPPQGDQDADEAEELDDETRLKWSPPTVVDDESLKDDAGNLFGRGHQTMPSLTFSQGRLMLVYYDTRLDHTRRYYKPNFPFAPVDGRFYTEELAPLGELLPGAIPDAVWASTITDAGLTQVRHTLDVRVAVAGPGPTQKWSSTQANKFAFGLRGDEFPYDGKPLTVAGFGAGAIEVVAADGTVNRLQQLQHNPPNLPIFKNGTKPFMGDYIDIQGPAFVATPAGWLFNTAPTAAPVFHAVWTSNQDVKVPPLVNGEPDWKGYTPIGGGGQSIYDASATTPACDARYAGSRDQNIYTVRITEGLAVSSPQNQKPLSPTATTAFVVAAQNTTPDAMAVDFAAAPGDSAGVADFSFQNDLAAGSVRKTTLRTTIPARSTVSLSLFARSASQSASVKVTVTERCTGTTTPCRAGFVTLNPPFALATLLQPDGTSAAVAAGEQYTIKVGAPNITAPNITAPNITAPNITARGLTNPNITAPNITAPNITAPNITAPNITALNLTNPNITAPNITAPNITAPNITAPNITAPNITAPNITAPNITATAVSDLSYTVVNTGNTTTSYTIRLVSNDPSWTPPTPLQLIVSRTYRTPAADGCALKEVAQDQIIASLPDVSGSIVQRSTVVDPNITAPNITAPNITAATVALPPGDSAVITLRGFVSLPAMAEIGTKASPTAIPQAFVPRPDVTYDNVATVLPGAGVVVLGAASATTLTYDRLTGVASVQVRPGSGAGATPTGQVSLVTSKNAVVAAFALDASGNGTTTLNPPLAGGTVLVAYYAGDAAYAGSTSSAVTVASSGGTIPTTASAGYSSALSEGVIYVNSTTGTGTPTGTVTITGNGALLATADLSTGTAAVGSVKLFLPLPQLAAGTMLQATYSGDANFQGSTSPAVAVTLTTSVTSLTDYDILASVARVRVDGAERPPTGTVTFSANGLILGSANLASGTPGPASVDLAATITRPGAGEQLVAVYSGDAAFATSTSNSMTVVKANSVTYFSNVDVANHLVEVDVIGMTGGPKPTGHVQLRVNGAIALDLDLATGVAGSTYIRVSATIPALVGGDVLSADYLGDPVYVPSAAPAQTVGKANSVTYFSTVDVATHLVEVDVVGSPTGVKPSGHVQLRVNGAIAVDLDLASGLVGSSFVRVSATLPALVGGDTVQADYLGDPIYQASATTSVPVGKANSVTVVSYDDAAGQVMVQVIGTNGSPPTGTVAVSVGGAPATAIDLSTGVVGPSYTAINVTVGLLARGTTIGASYAGSPIYLASAQTVTFPGVHSNLGVQSELTSATVTVFVEGFTLAPTGSVTVSRGGVVLGSVTVSPWSATTAGGSFANASLAAGDVLVASYDGGTYHRPIVSAPHVVQRAGSQTFASYDPATTVMTVDAVTNVGGVTPVHTPTGAVNVEAAGVPVASIGVTVGLPGQSRGTATLNGSAPVGKQVVACYEGDAVYLSSCSDPLTPTGFGTVTPARTARRFAAAVTVNGLVYVLGGRSGVTGTVTAVDVYDPTTGLWTAGASSPVSLDSGWGTPAAAVGTRIYAFPSPGGAAQPVQVYDTLTNSWSTQASLVPAGWSDGRAVELGGYIYIFVARGSQGAFRYDPATDTWLTLPSAPAGTLSTQFSLVALNGKIYLMGGTQGAIYRNNVLEFDPATNGWAQTLDLLHNGDGGNAVAMNGRIYFFAGGMFTVINTAVQVIDPVAGTVTDYPVAWLGARYGIAATSVNGTAYLVSGPTGGVDVTTVDAFYPVP